MFSNKRSIPEAPSLFPIDPVTYAETIRAGMRFSEQEIDFINANNLDTLADDDPIRYLLELRGRADLQQAPNSPYSKAYRAGICIGAATMRSQQSKLEEAGYALPQSAIDISMQSAGPDMIEKPSPGIALAWKLFRMPEWIDDPYDFKKYFDESNAMFMNGILQVAWKQNNFSFLEDQFKDDKFEDYVSRGIRDTFRIYEMQYGEKLKPSKDTITYNPKQHFLRDSKNGSWQMHSVADKVTGESVSTDTEILEPGELLDVLAERHLVSGWRSEESDISGKRRKESRVDVWWNGTVPPGRTLTHVRTHEAGHVMPAPGHDAQVSEVGFKNTLKEYELSRYDVLIVRGGKGKIMTLNYPFQANWDDVEYEDQKYSVDMLALCRDGKTYPLTHEIPALSPEEKAMISQIETEVLQFHQDRKFGKLGREIMAKVDRSTIMVANVPTVAYAGLKPHWNTIVDLPIDVGIGFASIALITALKNKAIKSPRIRLSPLPEQQGVEHDEQQSA